MSASIGTARHRYADGSEHQLRVEISAAASKGFPASVGEPYYFRPRVLDPDSVIHIAGARQARVLANYLTLLADRLEARGQL